MIAEKDKRIKEKDKTLATQDIAVAAAQEASDLATALVRIKDTYQDRKWGALAIRCLLSLLRLLSRLRYSC
jgi:hypothetical protein